MELIKQFIFCLESGIWLLAFFIYWHHYNEYSFWKNWADWNNNKLAQLLGTESTENFIIELLGVCLNSDLLFLWQNVNNFFHKSDVKTQITDERWTVHIQLRKMNVNPLAVSRCKMAVFKRVWQKVKMVSQPWTL